MEKSESVCEICTSTLKVTKAVSVSEVAAFSDDAATSESFGSLSKSLQTGNCQPAVKPKYYQRCNFHLRDFSKCVMCTICITPS